MGPVIHKEFLDAVVTLWLKGKRGTFPAGHSAGDPVSLIYIFLLTESIREKRDYWAGLVESYVFGVYEDVVGIGVPVTLKEIRAWLR